VIDGERANLDQLLAAEIDTQQKLATAIRDHESRAMVRSRSLADGLVQPIDKKLAALTGGANALPEARLRFAESQGFIDLQRRNLLDHGLTPPECGSIAGGATPQYIKEWLATRSPRVRAMVVSTLGELGKECGKNLSEAGIYSTLGGAIGSAWADYHREAVKLAADKAEMTGLQATYKQALGAYNESLAEAAGPHITVKVKAAASRVSETVEALKKSSSPYAAKLLSEARLQALDALAQAVAEAQPGQPLPQGASRAQVALTLLPQLADSAYAAADGKPPAMLPLVIRRNYEQLNLEAIQRDIAAREKIVSLSHDLVVTLYREAGQLQIARDELAQPKVVALHQLAFADAFGSTGTAERRALYSAAARYLDALNRLDAQRYALEYKRVAAYQEKNLAYAEINAKQWESLINTAVSQVAGYSASGIKPEELARLANSLGLLSIGIGVN
jgi:hypothetical protein